MKHYFLSGLSEQQKAALSENMVVVSEMVIGSKTGLLMDETNREFALQVLGATVESEKPTGYDGISELIITIGDAKDSKAGAGKNSKNPDAVPFVKPPRPELDAEHQKYRELYIAACSTRVNELIVQNRQTILTQRQSIEDTQRDLIRELRALRLDESRSSGAGIIDREAFLREFDNLTEVPKVKDIQVEDGTISVFTEMLFIDDPVMGKRHELGEYMIQFLTDGQADCVRWYNLTRRVNAGRDAQQAPQVFKSGRSSLHIIKDSLVDLIAEMQFAVACQLAIDFI